MTSLSPFKPNEVWTFKALSTGNGKMEVERRPASTTDAEALTRDVDHDGHTLSVWNDTGLADRCRTCGRVNLLKSELCEMIDRHNDKVK